MKTKQLYTLSPGLIHVCMFCTPGETILDLFPEHKGRQVSHGICQQHKEQQLSLIAREFPKQ